MRADAGSPRSRVWPYVAVLAILLLARLWFDVAAPPMGDEAYYWVWARHPSLSYFEHPPLHAWLQALVGAVLPWSPFTLRLTTWLSLGISLGAIAAFARRFGGPDPAGYFVKTAVLLVCLPVMQWATIPAFNDHLLVAFSLCALYAFASFADDWCAGRRNLRALYAAGVFVGLATLSKYNGALLAVGFLGAVVIHKPLRSALALPHLYAAAGLAVLMQAPVVAWNLQEGFASLNFHLVQRPSGHWTRADLPKAFRFFLYIAIAIGPVLYLTLPRLALPRSVIVTTPSAGVLRAIFVVCTLCVATVAAFTDVLLHWNVVAYAALLLLAVPLLNRWWLFWPQVVLCASLLFAGVINFSAWPSPFERAGAVENHGWPEVVDAVAAASLQHPGSFVATTDYTLSSRFAFAARDTDVMAFGPLPSQYDLWWDRAAHLGKDALILADNEHKIDSAAPLFREVTKIGEIPLRAGGKTLWSFELYLGRGYGAAAAN